MRDGWMDGWSDMTSFVLDLTWFILRNVIMWNTNFPLYRSSLLWAGLVFKTSLNINFHAPCLEMACQWKKARGCWERRSWRAVCTVASDCTSGTEWKASLNFNCGTMLSASPFTSRCTKPSLLFFLLSLLPNECAQLICSLISFAAISPSPGENVKSSDFAIFFLQRKTFPLCVWPSCLRWLAHVFIAFLSCAGFALQGIVSKLPESINMNNECILTLLLQSAHFVPAPTVLMYRVV